MTQRHDEPHRLYVRAAAPGEWSRAQGVDSAALGGAEDSAVRALAAPALAASDAVIATFPVPVDVRLGAAAGEGIVLIERDGEHALVVASTRAAPTVLARRRVEQHHHHVARPILVSLALVPPGLVALALDIVASPVEVGGWLYAELVLKKMG